MATATPTPARAAPRDERVYHPLDRLSGIIRRYIIVEGVLAIVLFLLAWFTLALVIDFVLFKSLAWDWVQDADWWLRLVALVAAVGVFAFIFVFRILRRLWT